MDKRTKYVFQRIQEQCHTLAVSKIAGPVNMDDP